MKKVFIIAEIGINHNGDLNIAKKLIEGAVLAGVDAVKFQKRTPELCVPEAQKSVIRETPWGKMTYLEYKHKLEFGKEEYDEIDRYCKEKGIIWFASAWDTESQLFLRQYNLKHNKIASAMLTNKELLNMVAEERKPTFVSTGMSTMEEIEQAVDIFEKRNCPICLMHCNSSYPAKTSDLNLNLIKTLREKFNVDVGYSGHEFGLTPTYIAVALGAVAVERHITLDRTMWGSDQVASVEIPGLLKMVRQIRSIQTAFGDGVKRVTEAEIPIRKKLRGV